MTGRDEVLLRRFHGSPDPELPECVCSLCGDWTDMPIRLFSEGGWEVRFHTDCFERVFEFRGKRFDVRAGLRVRLEWGDEPLPQGSDRDGRQGDVGDRVEAPPGEPLRGARRDEHGLRDLEGDGAADREGIGR